MEDLPSFSVGPKTWDNATLFTAVQEAGYEGIQFVTLPDAEALRLCRERRLLIAGSGRVNTPDEVRRLAQSFADTGMLGATLHVGWGLESDDEAHALIEAILEWSDRLRFPLWPETHRATLFQDMWRTRQFVERYPGLLLNGDFSHWYTGLEMVYGGFAKKLEFLAPVMSKIRFLHGRIGNPGCIQVSLSGCPDDDAPHREHFETLWTSAMRGFAKQTAPGSTMLFAVELLSSRIFYARDVLTPSGESQEDSDRWLQALLLCEIAKQCWANRSA